MKKQIGIIRNRFDRFTNIKKQAQRKKNRFQMVGKEETQDNNMISVTTNNSDPVSCGQLTEQTDQSSQIAVKLFKEARIKMSKVGELQKKMAQISKLRLTSLRQKQNEKYDENISKLAGQATKFILAAQGLMRQISKIEVGAAASKKILKSMQASLAGQIQEASRNLRNQQQQYFKRIKAYQASTNSAIQLTAEQRKSMEGEWELVEEKQQDTQNSRISELVSSISKLSSVYKELGQLVLAQGTVIDRIDYNLQQTEQHTTKAVVHLQNANAEVSSPFADKIIKSLAAAIIMLAIVLALKYMK